MAQNTHIKLLCQYLYHSNGKNIHTSPGNPSAVAPWRQKEMTNLGNLYCCYLRSEEKLE